MIDGLNYELVPSHGTKEVLGHFNTGDRPHEWGFREIPDYPYNARCEQLRNLRVARKIGLRDAAALMDLSPVEYSRLEYGAATCDFDLAEARLRTGGVEPTGEQGRTELLNEVRDRILGGGR